LRELLATPTGGGVKSKFTVPDLKVPDLPDRSVANANIESLANETAEASNARMAQKNFAADLERRKSPFMTPEQLAAEEKIQFDKRQALYDPVNAETQKVLDERRAALEERRGRRLSEAGLQLGLGMLGGRGNFASILSGAGKEAVGTYQKGQELDDAQNERIQDMHLKQQQALVAQKAGNMELAHRLTREAQADKLAID
jgi:Spy/CpxP family protein refolding chaperone